MNKKTKFEYIAAFNHSSKNSMGESLSSRDRALGFVRSRTDFSRMVVATISKLRSTFSMGLTFPWITVSITFLVKQ